MDREKLLSALGKYAGKLKYKLDKLDQMILSWAIDLDAEEFKGTDAELVKQEMLEYIVDGIHDDYKDTNKTSEDKDE